MSRERKIFLDELPKKYGFGANKDKLTVDWKNSIGYKVKFIYDDIEGEIEIINYKSKGQKLTIKYKDIVKPIKSSDILECRIGNILGKITSEFRIEIGTTFKDDKRDITIIDREYREVKCKDKTCRSGYTIKKQKWYKYYCNKDGNEDWILESNLLKGQGCNICKRKKINIKNCIYTTAKWMLDLGVSEEDSKTHSIGSGDKINVTCPYCGRPKMCVVNKIYSRKSINCSCGDGKSFPEKFILYSLEQTDEYFETEYSPEYLKREENGKLSQKRNDFYLPNHNIVIEADGGMGHEGGKTHAKSNHTLEECIEVDKWKEEQNLKHGIKTIRINCFKSELEYIKHSILTSELTNYINFSNVDWNKCEEYALKNIVKEVCDYWKEHREVNGEDITTKDLSYIFKYNKNTIIDYLKKGSKLEWCNYNPKEEMKRRGKTFGNKILMYDKEMNFIDEYDSVNYLDINSVKLFGVRLTSIGIRSVCNGKIPHYKGYIFKYKKYVENIS